MKKTKNEFFEKKKKNWIVSSIASHDLFKINFPLSPNAFYRKGENLCILLIYQ